MPEYSAGSMRNSITIQTEVRAADGGGGYAQTFVTNFIANSSINPISGNEQYKQGRLNDTQLYEFVIRYRDDKTISPSNRILWGSRIFQIRSALNHMERNKYWVIRAEEKVAT
tara:strand:+ start:296 stop:634 length:339 start_codon:yes stop_codon:yes gene_type:complete